MTTALTKPDQRSASPRISILVSDLSSKGAGRWSGAVRPFLLAKAIQQAGYTPEIIGFSHETSLKGTSDDIPIRIIPLQQGVHLWRSARQMLRSLTGDLIYAYKLKPGSFGLALLHRQRHHKPLLLDIDDWELSWHGGDSWRYRPTPKQLFRDTFKTGGALRNPEHPLYLQWMEKWTDRADHITTHNLFLQNRFGGTYLPNGKDTELFDPDQYDPETCRAALGLSDYRVLMFPGAPRPYKGVEDVLTALDRLNQPDLRLVIVGGSPYDDYDKHLRQRWGRWLIQLPKAKYEDMPRHIAAAHIVVVPQRDDPATRAQFPLKLTDGMSMAKPIVASHVGDIPNILGQTGYLVEPNAPQQLAEKIDHVFASYSSALEKAKLARFRCQQNFSILNMSHTLKPLLDSYLVKHNVTAS
ncbi:glycosyltransferase family 4 protein [Oscillatoria sp. CS-180]|uniref:glycosyltransferase family 4 protein n=1 Tax=Oscillatoria sp. CS-180 TaxID=3021720 RepID=UPI00232E3FEF|nr:glycosyltransferase family 4 protein [Oscillatoria sp. CS-180]MDB9526888.1 glycosyltransferase family 4 protein [Oscillatoria sp. CS-180]